MPSIDEAMTLLKEEYKCESSAEKLAKLDDKYFEERFKQAWELRRRVKTQQVKLGVKIDDDDDVFDSTVAM